METVRRELEPWLTGRRILEAVLVEAEPGPKYANLERAVGQRIQGVRRRGKFLILPLDEGELIIHLGMTGVISPNLPDKHLRVKLTLGPGANSVLYFRDARRFGRFLVVPTGDYRSLPALDEMGPEPLEPDFTPESFDAALQKSGVAVKSYLLSQKPVSGIGNIYADEALWRARIHPLTPAKSISKQKVAALHGALREVLEDSLEAQGTTLSDYRTVNGEAGAYARELKVYGHAGDPCPRCGRKLKRIVLAGRGTHYCPNCQRLRIKD